MQTDIAIHGRRGHAEAARVYVPADLQTLQDYQDKINVTIMVLEANNDVLASLRDFYKTLLENSAFALRETCREDVTSFTKQVDEMIHDSSMQISRAKLLIRITTDRKDLVSGLLAIHGLPNAKIFQDPTASSNSNDTEDGRLDNKHAKHWDRIPERSNHNANYHSSNFDIPPRNICLRKSTHPILKKS